MEPGRLITFVNKYSLDSPMNYYHPSPAHLTPITWTGEFVGLSREYLLTDIINLPGSILVLEISGQGEAGLADQFIVHLDESVFLCQLTPVACSGCVDYYRRL